MAFWWKQAPKPFICQVCGEISGPLRDQHDSIYVQGDWEGFSPLQLARYDPASTYLVNPAHPEHAIRIRAHPERVREMEASLSWGERWSGHLLDRLSVRSIVVIELLLLPYLLYLFYHYITYGP
jgi:hypothetical protein